MGMVHLNHRTCDPSDTGDLFPTYHLTAKMVGQKRSPCDGWTSLIAMWWSRTCGDGGDIYGWNTGKTMGQPWENGDLYGKSPFFNGYINVYGWLVVWNMAFIFPNSWDDDPIWRTPSFFRGIETTSSWFWEISWCLSGWWFGTMEFYDFHILGFSSSQLTKSSFSEG